MDRTRGGQSTHCSEGETEEAEAERYQKPRNWQMAENSVECRYASHTPQALEF